MGEWDDLKAISLGTNLNPDPGGEVIEGIDWGPADPETWKAVEATIRLKTFGKTTQARQMLQTAIRTLQLGGFDVEVVAHRVSVTSPPPPSSPSPGTDTPPDQGGA